MRKEEIDEIFKEGVHSEFPYDENLWDKVVDQLPAEKERKFGWVWYLNGFIILFIHFLTFGITESPILQPDARELNSSNTQLITEEPAEEIKRKTKDLTIQPSDEPENTEVAIHEKSVEESSNNSTTKDEDFTKINQTLKESTKSDNPFKETKADDPIVARVESTDKEPEPAELSTSDNSSMDLYSKNKNSVSNNDLDLELEPMPLLSSFPFKNRELAEPSFSSFEPKVIPQQKPIYVEFQYKYGISVNKEVSGIEDQMKEIKAEAEKTHTAEQIGILFLKDLGKFRVGIGARYFKLIERINYHVDQESENSTTTYDTSYTLVNSNFNQNGFPVWLIREDISSYTSVDRSVSNLAFQYENKLEYLQIPLTIGYNQTWNRYRIGLRAGLIGQYLLNAEGGYINAEETAVVSFDEADNLSKINLNSEAALRVGYGLNEFIWIGTEYNYQYGVTSLTKDHNSRLIGNYMGIWLQFKAF